MYGEKHGETITALHELANFHDNNNNSEKAKPLYELCLKILSEEFGLSEVIIIIMIIVIIVIYFYYY